MNDETLLRTKSSQGRTMNNETDSNRQELREDPRIEAVWCAAYDLKQAIQRAQEGHLEPHTMGTRLQREINTALRGSGFQVHLCAVTT